MDGHLMSALGQYINADMFCAAFRRYKELIIFAVAFR